jgi:FkbM family methyltransferase
MRLVRHLQIDLVLDVGANSGQFGLELRRHGYTGRMVSFEPLRAAYETLSRAVARDLLWEARNYGIGDFDGARRMHVAANSASSSLHEALPLHDEAAPEARYVGTEEVAIRRLDGAVDELVASAHATYLKIDVQGAEEAVLAGAVKTLPRISAVQLEMSLYPLHSGAASYAGLFEIMRLRGFQLAGLEPGLAAAVDGRLLQVDGLFIRDPAVVERSQGS